MSEFISRAKYDAIRRTLVKMAAENVRRAATPEHAAAQEGGQAAVSARLRRLQKELDEGLADLLTAARAEIDAAAVELDREN